MLQTTLFFLFSFHIIYMSSVIGEFNSDLESLQSDRIRKKRTQMMQLLFPNQSSYPHILAADHPRVDERQLVTTTNGTVDLSTVECTLCPTSTMIYCKSLANLLIQEVYYPNGAASGQPGTCAVLESLGERIYNEIFGTGRAFRDTSQCRDIVMQYLCLFWGSNNDMYENLCIYKEEVTSVNKLDHKVSPRPPCRSFCVQIAQVCANDPEYMLLCADIDCPPTEDACTPDPEISGKVLDAQIGCNLPFDTNPYASSAPRGRSFGLWNLLLLTISSAFTAIWLNT